MDFIFGKGSEVINNHMVPFFEHAVVPFVEEAAPVVAHHAGKAFEAAGEGLAKIDFGTDLNAGFDTVAKAAAPVFAATAASLEGTAQAAAAFFVANANLDQLVKDVHRDIERAVAKADGRVLAIGLAVAGGLVATAVLTPIVLYFGLPALGFTANGVTAGSAAAAWQSILGTVAAGSLFAILQSAAAGGYGVPLVAGAVGVGSGIAGGVAGGVAGAIEGSKH